MVCPHCRKVFNALSSLTDEHADPGELPVARHKAVAGMPPVLEKLGDDAVAGPGVPAAEAPNHYDSGAEQPPAAGAWNPGRAILLTAMPALIALLTWQLWTIPRASAGKADNAMTRSSGASAFRIVSRDLHRHPTQSGWRMLSLRVRNISDRPRPLPTIEIAWPAGAAVPTGTQRLRPRTYAGTPHTTIAPGGEGSGLIMIQSTNNDGGVDVRIR